MSNPGPQSPELSVEARMLALIVGFMAAPAIAVAARLRIADLLAAGPQSLDELVSATKVNSPSLSRLLRLLTSLGIFAEDPAGRYEQTLLSEILRSGVPRSLRDFAIMSGAEFNWRPWGELCETIMTGQPAFERVHGAAIPDYLLAHPDHAEIVNAAMTSLSSNELSEILSAYDFSRFTRIVDIGGGHGMLLHGILSANPRLRGVLADQPSVVAGAISLRTDPVADRCEVVGIDFFQTVPEGADAYIAKSVIHDWNDGNAVRILKNCRRAISRDGTLLLIERILKPSNQPDPAKFVDLAMLVLTSGGRERTEAEFRALLTEAGFSLIRVIPTAGALSIIESRAVQFCS
jgi:DNA-binding transcriptional ArsR family regulator